jgi:two-component system phosphate regulon response regulator PhoB
MHPAQRPHILVVEDEPAQREVLRYNLEAEGFRLSVAADGEEALLLAAEDPPDVIVLDWMLPLVSGPEICRRLRRDPQTQRTAIIMLSARTEESDKIQGLETGADDYMVKPYSLPELVARVRSQLRRIRPTTVMDELKHGTLRIDLEQRRVFLTDIEVPLGPTEFRLLEALIEKPGRVLSRGQLLDRVWGKDQYLDTRTVDVHVARLRKALTKSGAPDPIRTVRGAGYALD